MAGSALAGTVTGAVRARETHQPLGSKVVAAYDTTGTLRGSATTDQNGTYVLTLPAGGYRLLAYDVEGVYATMFDGNSGSFETTPVTTVPATGTVTRDFELIVGGYVTGIVTAPGGAPQSGAVVEVYNLSGTRRAFATTNAQGAYFIVLPPDEYKLVAYDPAGVYSYSFFRDATTFAESAPVAVTASRSTGNINFTLGIAVRIIGTAVEAGSGVPLSGIDVYAYTAAGAEVARTTTDAAGGFRFSLPAGGYRLVAADPLRKYATAFYDSARAFETTPVITLSGGQQSNVQIALPRSATISGRIVDASGAAVPNVTVAAYNLDGTLHASTVTRANGTYDLLVAPGAYKLAAFDPNLQFATRFLGGVRDFGISGSIGVAGGQTVSGFDISLIRGGRVSGTVRDGSQLRAGITVAAYDAAGILAASAITDSAGAYAFVVAPGDYRIVAFDTALHYAPSYDRGANSFDETVPRTITASATQTVDLSLRRGFIVSGDVFDGNGELVSGVNVFALDAAGNRVAGGLSMNGGFSLSVPAGTYDFVAIDPEGRYAIAHLDHAVTVTDAQTPRLRFTLQQVMRRRAARH